MTRLYSAFSLRWVRGRLAWMPAMYSGERADTLCFDRLERVAYVYRDGEKRLTRFTCHDAPSSFAPHEADEVVEVLNDQARRKYYRELARRERQRIRSETWRDPEAEDLERRSCRRQVQQMAAAFLRKPIERVGRADLRRYHRAHEQP